MLRKNLFMSVTFALLATCAATTSSAQALPTYPLSASPSATGWSVDRYAPSVFTNAGTLFGRNNVLDLGVAAADSLASRPSSFNSGFYNTQGRSITVGPLTAGSAVIGSLFIPSSWGTTNASDGGASSRRTDLWGAVKDSGGNVIAYPVIGFTNAPLNAGSDFSGAAGGTPRYRVYDFNGAGGWIDIPSVPVSYDTWTDFSITFTGPNIEYRINNQLVSTVPITPSNPGDHLDWVAVQGYNYNFTYHSNWAYFSAGQGSASQLLATVSGQSDPIYDPSAGYAQFNADMSGVAGMCAALQPYLPTGLVSDCADPARTYNAVAFPAR